MSNSFEIRPTDFSCGGENFSKGASPPMVTGLWTSVHHKNRTFSCVLYPLQQKSISQTRVCASQSICKPSMLSCQYLTRP